MDPEKQPERNWHNLVVVARLKRAGAIRVGKTNVPEFAAGSVTSASVGEVVIPFGHWLLVAVWAVVVAWPAALTVVFAGSGIGADS